MSKKSMFICPYCFSKNEVSDIEFRCSSEAKSCGYEKDIKLARFLGVESISMPKVIKSELRNNAEVPEEALCPSCNKISRKKICPECHSILHYNVGEDEDYIFAVIGAKETGKSHFISVLIDKIQNEMGESFNFSLQAMNDETLVRYREDFYNPVFKKKEIIQVTRSGKTDSRVRSPLLYTLTIKEKSKLPSLLSRKKNKVVTIAFFDSAGEDLNSEDTMEAVNKYIYNSSGMIFLLDPLQLSNVRKRLPAGTNLPNENTDMEDLLTRTANLVRKANNLKLNKLINIPLAVAFSKMDAVESLMDVSSSMNYPSKHIRDGYFNLNDFNDVNAEMKALVREWGGSNFENQLSMNFKRYAYFGVTALGCNPQGSNKIDRLSPHRIEDPFLWLLWQNNLIKAGKEY